MEEQQAQNFPTDIALTAARQVGMRSVLIGIAIFTAFIILFLLVLSIFMDDDGSQNQAEPSDQTQTTPSQQQLTITKTGPTAIANDGTIAYTLSTSYAGSGMVTIADTIPSNATYVDATHTPTLEKNENGDVIKVVWSVPANQRVNLTLRPTEKDTHVLNIAVASLTSGFITPGASGAAEVLGIGEHIKVAYEQCGSPRGSTFTHSTLGSCLRNILATNGYSPAQLDAFEQRRITSMVPHDKQNGTPSSCNECQGYVGTVISLWTGNSESLRADYASLLGIPNSHQVGPYTYIKITDGSMQAGDIAVKLRTSTNTWGHVAFVREVKGNSKFIALEGNQDNFCNVANFREVPNDGYVFFRKQ